MKNFNNIEKENMSLHRNVSVILTSYRAGYSFRELVAFHYCLKPLVKGVGEGLQP